MTEPEPSANDRVAVQSGFEPLEDNGRTIPSHSEATHHQW